MLINCRTTDNKKVPSFRSSSGSQTKPELSDPSFSASAATLTEETENEDKNQTDRMASTDETEDTFLRGVISDLCRGDQGDIRVGETAEGVSQGKALKDSTVVVPFCIRKETTTRMILIRLVVLL